MPIFTDITVLIRFQLRHFLDVSPCGRDLQKPSRPSPGYTLLPDASFFPGFFDLGARIGVSDEILTLLVLPFTFLPWRTSRLRRNLLSIPPPPTNFPLSSSRQQPPPLVLIPPFLPPILLTLNLPFLVAFQRLYSPPGSCPERLSFAPKPRCYTPPASIYTLRFSFGFFFQKLTSLFSFHPPPEAPGFRPRPSLSFRMFNSLPFLRPHIFEYPSHRECPHCAVRPPYSIHQLRSHAALLSAYRFVVSVRAPLSLTEEKKVDST